MIRSRALALSRYIIATVKDITVARRANAESANPPFIKPIPNNSGMKITISRMSGGEESVQKMAAVRRWGFWGISATLQEGTAAL